LSDTFAANLVGAQISTKVGVSGDFGAPGKMHHVCEIFRRIRFSRGEAAKDRRY
jgi:hypothetical protein